jgi:hypothetical protein
MIALPNAARKHVSENVAGYRFAKWFFRHSAGSQSFSLGRFNLLKLALLNVGEARNRL